MIPPCLILNQKADIKTTFTSHLIWAKTREIIKDPPKKRQAVALAECQGMWGGSGLWGWRNAGLPISFPKHSLLQQTKYFHMLLLEHPGSWSNRGAASRARLVLLGQWSSLQPGLGPTAWHWVSPQFLFFIQCLSGFRFLLFFHRPSLISPCVAGSSWFHPPHQWVLLSSVQGRELLSKSLCDPRETQDSCISGSYIQDR